MVHTVLGLNFSRLSVLMCRVHIRHRGSVNIASFWGFSRSNQDLNFRAFIYKDHLVGLFWWWLHALELYLLQAFIENYFSAMIVLDFCFLATLALPINPLPPKFLTIPVLISEYPIVSLKSTNFSLIVIWDRKSLGSGSKTWAWDSGSWWSRP